METVPSPGAKIIYDAISGDYRYRIAETPMGFLITARSRDLVGLVITEEWLHRTERAARACMEAVEAGHRAWKSIGQQHSSGAMATFERLSETHRAICLKSDDQPVVGQEVRQLREELLRDDAAPEVF
jgi:hypothetical protein